MNLTFLAHDAEGNMRLLKYTSASDTPDVKREWERAVRLWKEKVPLLGGLSLVGALTVTPEQSVRWYPDVTDDASAVVIAEMVGQTLH